MRYVTLSCSKNLALWKMWMHNYIIFVDVWLNETLHRLFQTFAHVVKVSQSFTLLDVKLPVTLNIRWTLNMLCICFSLRLGLSFISLELSVRCYHGVDGVTPSVYLTARNAAGLDRIVLIALITWVLSLTCDAGIERTPSRVTWARCGGGVRPNQRASEC